MTLKKDIIKLYFLFFISVAIIYKTPQSVIFIFQIILLSIFFLSKNDYFWLAFVFIIESNPGGLFFSQDTHHSFSLITSSPLGNLYFWIIFTLLAFIKALSTYEKSSQKFFLRKEIILLAIYFIILIFAFGIYRFSPVFRMLLPWLYLIILPRFFNSLKDYAKFFNLIFAFVPIVLLMQSYSLVFGKTIAALLGGFSNASERLKTIEEANQALRPWNGIFIPWMSLLGAVLFLSYDKRLFSRVWLNIIVGLSIFSIFITATRSWLIASMVVFIGYNLLNSFNPIKLISKYIFPVLLLILIILYTPFLKKQAEMSLMRYETIQLLINGDVTAGGTLSRFDVRGPKVMKHFFESPILGWGYGKQGAEYADVHVGHQNLLMQTGIIGYSLFFYLWISFIIKMINSYFRFSKNNSMKKIPIILVLFFLGIHIINVAVLWFNYLLRFEAGFVICLLFSIGNFVYQRAHLDTQMA